MSEGLEARVEALEAEVFGVAKTGAADPSRAFGPQDTAPPTIAGTEEASSTDSASTSESGSEPSAPSTPAESPAPPAVSPTLSTPAEPDTSSL